MSLFKIHLINRVYYKVAYLYIYISVSDLSATIPKYCLYTRYPPVTQLAERFEYELN